MAERELIVKGMTCEHCERAVTAELSAIDGVDVLSADAATGRIRIAHRGAVDDAVVDAAVVEAGYVFDGWASEADA